MTILDAKTARFDAGVLIVIVGGGAAGHVAALAAHSAGVEALILERDAVPQGSTALSSGLIPAAGTKFQRAKNIADSPEQFAADLQRKAKRQADAQLVETIAREAGPTIDWLADRYAIPFELVEGFLYPGHSVLRMHGTKRRTGAELMAHLAAAAAVAGIDTMTEATVDALYADGNRIAGVRIVRPDGGHESIGCTALVLACCGFGGNGEMLRAWIPEMADALFMGHTGNKGDGILWGQALGGAVRHMGAYQGHGSVATPHNILITWALMMEGGFQVNQRGARFSNEHGGYSEQAVHVLAQPGGIAFDIYDERLHTLGLTFEDYRDADKAGAIKRADSVDALAAQLNIDAAGLRDTFRDVARLVRAEKPDEFGRDFTGKPALTPPYYGVRVTGSLFHTQGGLVVDGSGRVLRADGSRLPNLFAAGGAACGVSGPAVWGYLSGNGLLTAATLGRLAGQAAAELARAARSDG
ncbi:MAG: FAD-dependent oxidoreductase [Alphaproteobacteria bacterium]